MEVKGVLLRGAWAVWPTGKLGTCRPRWENAAGVKVVPWGRQGVEEAGWEDRVGAGEGEERQGEALIFPLRSRAGLTTGALPTPSQPRFLPLLEDTAGHSRPVPRS